MPRVMCIWLPFWPIQRLRAARFAAPALDVPDANRRRESPGGEASSPRENRHHPATYVAGSEARQVKILPHGKRGLALYAPAPRGKLVIAAASSEAAARGIAP